MVYKLYYKDPFTGKQLLYAKYTNRKELLEAWLNPDFNNYVLEAVEEVPIKNLPTRPRHSFNNNY